MRMANRNNTIRSGGMGRMNTGSQRDSVAEEDSFDFSEGPNRIVGLGIENRFPLNPSNPATYTGISHPQINISPDYQTYGQDDHLYGLATSDFTPHSSHTGAHNGGEYDQRPSNRSTKASSEYSEYLEAPSMYMPSNLAASQSPRSILIGFDNSSQAYGNAYGPQPHQASTAPQSRRGQSTGPPPVRRGGSSYYSQIGAAVSPIPEESPNPRHGSYASSHVIPSTWGVASPIEYNSFDESREGEGETNRDHAALVRQASLGKKSKPVLKEIRSSKHDMPKPPPQTFLRSNSDETMSSDGQHPVELTSIPSLDEKLGSSSPYAFPLPMEPPSFEAIRKEVENAQANASLNHSRTSSQFTTSAARNSAPLAFPVPPRGLKGRRIPPGLNINAVRDAEARGSLTSLPDLIRRATKLAAVLENGRPGSTLRGIIITFLWK